MKIPTWTPLLTDALAKDVAYWERNMLALRYAGGWYNDDVPRRDWTCNHEDSYSEPDTNATICRECDELEDAEARFPGWRRVLSLESGKLTFHVPDDFDLGNLPQIAPNWDGHTTEEKWRRVLEARDIKPG